MMSLQASAGRVAPCSSGRTGTKRAKQSHVTIKEEIASGFALAMTYKKEKS